MYGVDLADGTIAWDIPRLGGPISAPAVGVADEQEVLVYLEGPAPEPDAGASPTTSVTPTNGAATGPTTTTSPGPTIGDDDDGVVSELVGVTLADQAERWRVQLEEVSRSGVTIDGDTVYVGDQGGTLSAFSLADGTPRWSNTVTGRIDTPVAVADGTVYAVARDSEEVRVALVAFDAATGERAWPPLTVPASSTAGSAPSAGDGRLIVGSADRVVRAVGADDGTEAWTSLVLSLFSPGTAPAIGDGDVFVADFAGGLYRLDGADGTRRWSHQLNEVILRGAPVVSGAAVLVGLEDGRLVAVDVGSGHLIWERDLTEGSLGAIAIADDVVIAVTGGPDAGLVALENDPDGALIDVPSPTEFDPGTTFARYAAAAGIVFVVAFVPGVFARRRFGSRIEPGGEPDDDVEIVEGEIDEERRMSGKKGRRRRPAPAFAPEPRELEPVESGQEAPPRRPFGSALFGGGPSILPSIPRSLGRGLLAIVSSPILLATALVLPVLVWLALLAIGFEGSAGRLVDVLALPPISTYFDLGTGASVVGVGPAFLVFTAVSVLIRGVVYALLAGMIVEALEDGRVSSYGVLRGIAAIPTILVVQVIAFSLIIAGNIVFPILGPGIGFLAFVAALVGGLYFLGFAPTAAVRERRGVVETIRRSGRAASLPGTRQLLFCALYFFVALPVVVGLVPGGTELTANPTLAAWIFILAVSVVHLAFMAALAYRWIAAEPQVPDEPVRRRGSRAAGREPSQRPRGRR